MPTGQRPSAVGMATDPDGKVVGEILVGARAARPSWLKPVLVVAEDSTGAALGYFLAGLIARLSHPHVRKFYNFPSLRTGGRWSVCTSSLPTPTTLRPRVHNTLNLCLFWPSSWGRSQLLAGAI